MLLFILSDRATTLVILLVNVGQYFADSCLVFGLKKSYWISVFFSFISLICDFPTVHILRAYNMKNVLLFFRQN